MDNPNSRRQFLQAAALSASAVAIGACHGPSAQSATSDVAAPAYLDANERGFLAAATERLLPGAPQAGVVTFIDRQLAGPYGMAQTWYMQGPWQKGTEQQGYQSKLTPAQLYRSAIRAIEKWCTDKHGKAFEKLSPDAQDALLHELEDGKPDLDGVPAKAFFQMLLQNTQEGYLADPMYGGNRDFAGWKLIGFPGPRYNYLAEIEQYGKSYTLPVVGLKGRGDLKRDGG